MRIRAVLTVSEAESFCDTFDAMKSGRNLSGTQLHRLRTAIGQPEKSSSVLTRWCLFYKLHGREKFIDFFARAKGQNLSELDYLQILEYAVTSGTSIDRAWVIFRCSRRKLERLSLKRKKSDSWPQVEPAVPPADIVRLLDDTTLSQRLEAADDHELSSGEQDKNQSNGSVLQGDTVIAVGSTAQKVTPVQAHPHIHGKSKKEVITLQRPAFKARRKDIAAAKKEQEAIEQAKALGDKTIANMAQSSSTVVGPIVNAPQPNGDTDAYERFCAIKDSLKAPEEYDPLQRGRKPYFNPKAPTFSLLPPEIQQSSLEYFWLLDEAYSTAYRVAKSIPDNASQEERFKACYEFVQQHPQYPLKVVILPFRINYDNFKYYEKYRPRGISQEDPYLKSGAYQCLVQCFNESGGRYGKYRLRQMMYNRGYRYCVPTIAKLMKRCNLKAVVATKKGQGAYSSYIGKVGQLAPNLLKRDFTADKPFQKICSDVTEINFKGSKVYLSVFEDLFNNEIRAYSISASPSVHFVVAGLKKLVDAVPKDARCIIHTDQGHHYQRATYQEVFAKNPNIIQSMSRKGNCYDNGSCESWFGRFKDDVIKGQTYASVDELVAAIERYIAYYNNSRIQMELCGKSPVEYAHWVASNDGDTAA